MTSNPTPEQMRDMIEALFAKTDEFRAHHELDPPGDQTGFTELLRLVFSDDATGQAIFSSFDEELLSALWKMYQERVLVEMK
jgi:hypothetical protein